MPRRGTRNKLLRDMKRVYDHPEHIPGETGALKALRDLWEKDPDKFLDRLGKLEQAHAAKIRAGNGAASAAGGTAAGSTITQPPAPAPIQDEGSERAEEVIARLLDEFEREHPQSARS